MTKLNEIVDMDVMTAYTFHAVILIVKMMLMSPLTGYLRMKNKAFANPEDAATFVKGEAAKKYLRTDPDVERVRRLHRNDLENIIPFLFIAFFYSFTGISETTALIHFRIFTAARLLHTIAYLVPLPQPCRGLGFGVGLLVTFSMIFQLLWNGLNLL
ncbi:microsomal glutathione S-transferase 1 [Zootoca vivipara]|uniref:microsomal glutathione S-transferase 1 n=1 Tax=Zootoca vivipara TaxID=8524 RepID=UPI00293BA97D|nr:microsomal glutathione S-transferase 1 [Zootoca vivipara]XP_034983203.2 microsomal glutathione S-transferase 1 [Zootoca vivipara]